MLKITAAALGNQDFKRDYGLRYAYLAGAMYKGIASPELVVAMGRAGFLGYLGTGGMRLPRLETAIQFIQQHLKPTQAYGMNLLCNLIKPSLEEETVALFLKYGIKRIEAAAYMQMTTSLVWFRLKNLRVKSNNDIEIPHQVIAKVSRPEVAEAFMSPAPPTLVKQLVERKLLTAEEARLGEKIPMADDICVEADSGGHTDQGVAYVLMPAMRILRDNLMKRFGYQKKIRVGAAGGIGTPEAAAAAFMMGADFVLTGSINQCTVEAGTSDAVKTLLQDLNVQDTEYAPAGDMFELGARVQVVKRGLLFPMRANKLYELYRRYNSLDEIDAKTQQQLQERYFKRTFDQIWEETRQFYLQEKPDEITRAEQNPKHKMALVFRWYFVHTTRLAMKGSTEQQVDYQVHCGPALGAFNQWVKGTPWENWRERHVAAMGEKLMEETAEIFNRRLAMLEDNMQQTSSSLPLAEGVV